MKIYTALVTAIIAAILLMACSDEKRELTQTELDSITDLYQPGALQAFPRPGDTVPAVTISEGSRLQTAMADAAAGCTYSSTGTWMTAKCTSLESSLWAINYAEQLGWDTCSEPRAVIGGWAFDCDELGESGGTEEPR